MIGTCQNWYFRTGRQFAKEGGERNFLSGYRRMKCKQKNVFISSPFQNGCWGLPDVQFGAKVSEGEEERDEIIRLENLLFSCPPGALCNVISHIRKINIYLPVRSKRFR